MKPGYEEKLMQYNRAELFNVPFITNFGATGRY